MGGMGHGLMMLRWPKHIPPHLANDWWIDPDRRLGVIIWGDYQALGSH